MTDAMSVVSVDTMHMIALEVGKDMEKVVVVEERGTIILLQRKTFVFI